MTAKAQYFEHRVATSRKLRFPLLDTNNKPFNQTITTAEFILARDVNQIESAFLIRRSLGDGVAIIEQRGVQIMVVTLKPVDTDIAPGDYYFENHVGWGDAELTVVTEGKARFLKRLP